MQNESARQAHAEAVEILNKPGRYNVIYRAAGQYGLICMNNFNNGYSLEEANALVLKMKGCPSCRKGA